MNKYRIYFEPHDVEDNSPDDVQIHYIMGHYKASISRIVPIDKDGFPIDL